MLITEPKAVQREIHVAPCLVCGHTEINLSDSNYSSFNQGGGTCKKCGHQVYRGVSCNPDIDSLAAIWNAANDVPTLIKAEEAKIEAAKLRIADLKTKLSPFIPLSESDKKCLMLAADYLEDCDDGFLTADDGTGYWATATHKSELSIYSPQPDWATHVVWYNR